MATKIHEPKPVTTDLDGFPGATIIAYPGTRDYATLYRPCYLGQALGLDTEDYNIAEQRCIAAWAQAHPEPVTAELVPDPETWTAISAEADARELPVNLVITLTATPEQLQVAAADLGLAAPLHPSPELDDATYAAIWDARSKALGLVAAALQQPEPFYVPTTTWIATAHVSLMQRLELRHGQRSLLVIQITETSQGYISTFRREFDDEGKARAWMSVECARLAGAARAVVA